MSLFMPMEMMPKSELDIRLKRVRKLLSEHVPDAGGLLVFSRVNIYYLTGHMANGVLWVPLQGEPVLMCRRGEARARLESPMKNICSFRSYGDVPGLAADAGSPLTERTAAEMGGLPWNLSQLLTSRLPEVEFLPGDKVLTLARAVKTEWELTKMRLAGQRHSRSLQEILPGKISPGMTEYEIGIAVWEVFFSQGHQGILRMGAYGEEIFLGHVAAGESGNFPSVFNGPVGIRGMHPAAPHMGYAGSVWQQGDPLILDVGFFLEGYNSDKTQLYFSKDNGKISDDALRAHDFCVEMQAWLSENLKPGAIPSELYRHCVQQAEKQGYAEGFMALEPNKVVFLGHGIGLAIDEYPVLAKGFDAPLETGMTLALEPKFGIPGYGMVGVENTFEVTDTGGKCLTGDDYSPVYV